jgi:hypothetical protein
MTSSLRYEDSLEGISNYLQWKVRIAVVLRGNKLWAFVSTTVIVTSSDPISLDLHEVKEARAQRIILDGVRDHLVPHLAEKLTTKEMWDVLPPYTHLRDVEEILNPLGVSLRASES